jgi:hypothetical protein
MSKESIKKEANLYDKIFKENIDAVIENFIHKTTIANFRKTS